MKLVHMMGCVALLGFSTSESLAQNIVVPNSLANVEGNANNGFPFNISDFSLSTLRYQQVYAVSEFSSLTSPTLITAISFRPDSASGAAFNTNLPNLQINLSTTAAAPDGLSLTFSSNVGGNDTLVYSGALPLSSSYTGGPPRNFDIVITLQTPFLYDPTVGNLLMDVRNFGAGTTTQFDSEDTFGDSVSRVSTFTVNGVGQGDADFEDSSGLVTQFTFAAVPEPTTWALIGVCTLGSGMYTWRKGRQAIKNRFARAK